jgi:hypothetical protein
MLIFCPHIQEQGQFSRNSIQIVITEAFNTLLNQFIRINAHIG